MIPDSVTSVGREAFANCVLLESVTIGDNVAAGEINWLTFSYNWNENRGGLKTVTVGRWIENNSLSFLPNLENVIVRDGATKIPDKAFNNMKKLKSVSLCEGIGSIGEKAFSDCESLASLKIPDSVRSIGNNAFDNCASLKYNEYGGGYYLGSEENPY